MLEKKCVHTFTQGGQHIVVDGNSGAVHVVDEYALRVIEEILQNGRIRELGQIVPEFSGRGDLAYAAEEVAELTAAGLLFSPDLSEVPERTGVVVKALCLNVAHDCNLRCDYCFASTGDFGGSRELMPLDVAKQAVDFLIANSGNRRHLEIDFFGGEPLLNRDVVKETVAYGKERAAESGKEFRFTLTTNGIGLTPEIEEFINKEMYNVVLSLDGRKEVNDSIRHTISGRGSVYETIVPKFQRLLDGRGGKSYYVRGTFTARNLDFAEDVLHLSELGFKEISVEPVVTDAEADYALTEEHLPAVLSEYERLADLYLERRTSERPFNFFHFNVELRQGPCLYKRLTGCGAGYEYLAVTPQGELYPCHQFVGEEEYRLGDIFSGVTNTELPRRFEESNVLNKPVCQDCWAKFYCSGGCHRNNIAMLLASRSATVATRRAVTRVPIKPTLVSLWVSPRAEAVG